MQPQNKSNTLLLAGLLAVFVVIAILLGVITVTLLSDKDSESKKDNDNTAVEVIQPTTVIPTKAVTEEVVPTDAPISPTQDPDAQYVGTWHAQFNGGFMTSDLTLRLEDNHTFVLEDRQREPESFGCAAVDVTFVTQGNYTLSGSQLLLTYTSTTPDTYTRCGLPSYNPYIPGAQNTYRIISDTQISYDSAGVMYTR
jgi:hypothetical protein